MSHNKIKVAGQEPDSSGNITMTVSNLSDVTGTPSNGTYLIYDGTNFVNTSTATVTVQSIFLGEGASSAYPRTLANNEEVCFYDTNPHNTITSATLNGLSGSADWYESVTLPTGTYYMRGVCVGDFTSSSNPNMQYRFYDGSALNGATGASYDDLASGGQFPYESTALFSVSGSTTIELRITSVSNANSTTTSNQSQYGHLYIMKVG